MIIGDKKNNYHLMFLMMRLIKFIREEFYQVLLEARFVEQVIGDFCFFMFQKKIKKIFN